MPKAPRTDHKSPRKTEGDLTPAVDWELDPMTRHVDGQLREAAFKYEKLILLITAKLETLRRLWIDQGMSYPLWFADIVNEMASLQALAVFLHAHFSRLCPADQARFRRSGALLNLRDPDAEGPGRLLYDTPEFREKWDKPFPAPTEETTPKPAPVVVPAGLTAEDLRTKILDSFSKKLKELKENETPKPKPVARPPAGGPRGVDGDESEMDLLERIGTLRRKP